MELVIGFVVGLFVGWNFLSQPAWMKSKIDALKAKF